jgi:hypothetical protein
MTKGSSDHVRRVARRDYVQSAKSTEELQIPLGELQKALQMEGFPSGHLRQIRTSLESSLFWEPLGLKLASERGQPDRVGTVLRFAFATAKGHNSTTPKVKDPLLELSGVLRGAIREGAAAFLKELRKDKEPEEVPRRGEESAA